MKKYLGLFIPLLILIFSSCADKAEVGNLVPEGAVYYVSVQSQMLGNYDGASRVINEGEPFPDTVSTGDTYVFGDYEYRYNMCFITSHGGVDYPVWQENPYGSENAVAVHIRHLREKIEINPSEPRYLKVVWGQGYKMEGGRK